jgi:hypothetical protein
MSKVEFHLVGTSKMGFKSLISLLLQALLNLSLLKEEARILTISSLS